MKTTSGSIVIQNSEFYEIYRGKSDRIIIRQEMDGETHHLSVSPDRAEKLAAAILDIAKQIPQ